jgi:hypothetical protein
MLQNSAAAAGCTKLLWPFAYSRKSLGASVSPPGPPTPLLAKQILAVAPPVSLGQLVPGAYRHPAGPPSFPLVSQLSSC